MLRRWMLYNFSLAYRLDRWVRDRFTVEGRVLLGALLGAGVWGVNTRATLAYQLFAMIVSLGGVALAAAFAFRTGFRASRRMPRYATVGRACRYRVAMEHDARRVQRGLWLRDTLAFEPPSVAEFARAGRAVEQGGNWFDRRVGYPRWATLMRARRGASLAPSPLPELPPRLATEVELTLTPLRRGYLQFAPLRVQRPDPLGLFLAERRTGSRERLLVLPRRYPVAWRAWSGGSRERLGGASVAATTGGSLEYAASREYRAGDPRRLIDWRGWARLGSPVVKEFHDECFVRQALVLDTASDGPEDRFEAAVSVAASFAAVAPEAAGVVELLFVGSRAFRVEAGPGLGTSAGMLEALACAAPAPPDHFALLERAVMKHADDLSAAVLVLLDWDEPRRALARRLHALGADLLVLVVTGDGEGGAALDPIPELSPARLRRVPCAAVGDALASLGAGDVPAERP